MRESEAAGTRTWRLLSRGASHRDGEHPTPHCIPCIQPISLLSSTWEEKLHTCEVHLEAALAIYPTSYLTKQSLPTVIGGRQDIALGDKVKVQSSSNWGECGGNVDPPPTLR